MKRVLLLLALGLPAAADDRVEIRPGVKEGSKITRISKGRGAGRITLEQNGTETELGCELKTDDEIAEEIVGVEKGEIAKARRMIRRKESVFSVPAQDQSTKKTDPLIGQILTVERKGAGAEATSDDPKADAAALKKVGFDSEWFIPVASGAAVAPGDSWEPDAKAVRDWAEGANRKVKEISMSCTFRGVEERGGRRCAKIAVEIAAKGSMKTESGIDQASEWAEAGDVWFGVEEGRILGYELKMSLSLTWDDGKKTAPKHYSSVMSLDLTGESRCGEADFAKPGTEAPK